MSVLIAVPCGESGRFSASSSTVGNLERPHGSELQPFQGPSIPQNLNAAAEYFLKSSHSHLFLVNDDQLYDPTTLIRLLAHERPVITGLTTFRVYPYLPAIFGPRGGPDNMPQQLYLKPGMHGIVPIYYCGDHSLLIERRVIEAMRTPRWASRTDAWPDPDKIQHDVIFCDGIRAAGFDLVCDLDTPVGHLAVVPVVPGRDASGAWQTGLRLSNTHWYRLPAARPEKVRA